MVQAYTHKDSENFTKGGQSHFCIGGRDENGRDCYNQISELIIESLMELDTHIPEVSLRWTNDTPREVLSIFLNARKMIKTNVLHLQMMTEDLKHIQKYVDFLIKRRLITLW